MACAVTAQRRASGFGPKLDRRTLRQVLALLSVAKTVQLAPLPSSLSTVSARGTDNVTNTMHARSTGEGACCYNRPNTAPRPRVTQAACMLQGPRHLASWAATTSSHRPYLVHTIRLSAMQLEYRRFETPCRTSRGYGDYRFGLAAPHQRVRLYYSGWAHFCRD